MNPLNQNLLVAASHGINFTSFFADPCYAYTSSDGGLTWSLPIPLPRVYSDDICSDPVVRYAPQDGSSPGDTSPGVRVYATYLLISSFINIANVVVTHSDDNGHSWSAPIVAISGSENKFPDKPWLATPYNFPAASGDSKNDRVYVTSTIFTNNPKSISCKIAFSRSLDGGESFPRASTPLILASSPNCDTGSVIEGARPAGGLSNTVLACWYNSEADGFLTGVFDIRCKTSLDSGKTFGSEITAVDNIANELAYYEGPFFSYKRWFGGMLPAIEISADGAAHIVIAADPTSDQTDAEAGDIYYTTSTAAPYASWSLPIKLNDDTTGLAQGYPTITSKTDGTKVVLLAAWEDSRKSPNPAFSPNIGYDIFGAIANPTFGSTPNFRISDKTSINDAYFTGDYIDSAGFKGKIAHVIWTDRRDNLGPGNPDDDVATDRVTLPS